MDNFGQEQHPDPLADVGQRLGQGLAVLATLGEAAARLAAEEMRRRERREEQAQGLRDAQDRARARDELARHAEGRRAANHDRRIIAQGLDGDWLARADLLDLATVWRTAHLRQGQFPEAVAVARDVEQRLGEIYPRPMDLYDQAVANGASPAAAMRVAAVEMAHTPVMRAHGGRDSAAIGAAPQPAAGPDAFETAVRQERARLVDGVNLAAYTDELQRLGVGGNAAAQALREVLAARADQELRQGHADAATPDNPRTTNTDEHAIDGMPRNSHDTADANRDASTAAKLAAQWYPDGAREPGAMPAHVAGRRPANAPTQTGKRTTARSQ